MSTNYGSIVRAKLRANPSVKDVATDLNLSVATIYRHSTGMDLELIKILNELDKETKDSVLGELAVRQTKDLQVWLGCSYQYIQELADGFRKAS